jgi:protein involved in polysaccharide export with SLBB domain
MPAAPPAPPMPPAPPVPLVPTGQAIRPTDVLLLDAVHCVPGPSYRVEPLDSLLIQVTGTEAEKPIVGQFEVSSEGTVDLGFDYGEVGVVGLTPEQTANVIKLGLSRFLADPQVTVALAQFGGVQQVRGEHPVDPDGTITLGSYGRVSVAGLSAEQARSAIEKHLGQFLQDPQVSVQVAANGP